MLLNSKAVTCLAFSIDGITLVSGSEDGTVRVWDAKRKHVVRVLKHMKGTNEEYIGLYWMIYFGSFAL